MVWVLLLISLLLGVYLVCAAQARGVLNMLYIFGILVLLGLFALCGAFIAGAERL